MRTDTRFIVPFGTQAEFAKALGDRLHGKHVPVAAYPNPLPPRLGLLFKEDAPAVCIECAVYHYFDTIMVYAYLCERDRARVDLLTIIVGASAKYVYPATTDIDQIAQDVAGRFWETMRLDATAQQRSK
jgi:hypothetical protein